MKKVDMLLKELDNRIAHFDKESTKHKDMYRRLRVAVFCLVAISTVLAAVASEFVHHHLSPEFVRFLVVVSTALAGVITSIEGMRKPAELWMLEPSTLYALRDLRRELEYATAEPIAEPNMDYYFQRMQGILAASGEKWAAQQSAQSGAKQVQGHGDKP